jgi:branched-chain amino acid transport system permease protein
MDNNLYFLLTSILKIAGIIAFIYGLLKVMGHSSMWVKIAGILVAFGIIQAALIIPIGDSPLLNAFDSGLLLQGCTMAMVALGLNLIYGFNGQFSLGQWGFYGLGAYCAADITYRWNFGDSRGLLVVGLGVIFAGMAILAIFRLLEKNRGVPVLSAFTMYLLAVVISTIVAVFVANMLNNVIAPMLGTIDNPGPLNSMIAKQVVLFLAVILAGVFSAEVSFLFGLPVFTLGSDYFGIATLGFSIVIYTLMNNSDTILPFPEMKGGRGMIGIEKLNELGWFWGFFFLVFVIILMRNIINSGIGRTIKAVREDETAARAMGINVANNKLLAFVIGSFFAGIGGGVYAHYIGFLSPGTFSFLAGFNPLIIVVFGGLGSMTGTIAASFGWTFFLEGMLRNLLATMGTEAPTWRLVLYPIALLLLMLLRPQGLLGTAEWGFLKAKLMQYKKKPIEEPASVPTGK